MADRRFQDASGARWDVRVRTRNEWWFEPVAGNPGARRTVTPPGYESDPFEMSVEELQRLLGAVPGPASRPKSSPFLD